MHCRCAPCEPPSVVNGQRTSCRACPPGAGPSEEFTSCMTCNGTWYSQIGVCQQCDPPNVVNPAHTTCSRCTPGQAPNTDRTECEACVGLSYSPLGGECLECRHPFIVDSEHTSCVQCRAGLGPVCAESTEDPSDSSSVVCSRYDCQECEEQHYSSIGVCQLCQDGFVVVAERTACQESSCPAGTECPTAQCTQASECVACSIGNVSLGGSCTPCIADGKVANPSQSSCEACSAGAQPNALRSQCEGCTANTFSMFGWECMECELPSVVDER